MVTGFTFLSRLTQIAQPHTRFVFLGAGLRLGLPSHPASRRRSCLRLGVSTTSSSRGLSPPIDRPCRAYSRRLRCAPPLARHQRRARPWGPARRTPGHTRAGTAHQWAHPPRALPQALRPFLGSVCSARRRNVRLGSSVRGDAGLPGCAARWGPFQAGWPQREVLAGTRDFPVPAAWHRRAAHFVRGSGRDLGPRRTGPIGSS